MAQSFSDNPRHLESVEHRQAQVDQRDHWGAREGGVEASPAVRSHLHIVALQLQDLTQHLTAVFVILDDEDAWPRTGPELGGSAPRIRCLREWGGNGHHLAEPRRIALAARGPRCGWPLSENISRRISERPIVIMSCSPFTAGARGRQEISAVQRSAEGGFDGLPALEPASLKKAADRIHGIVHPPWTMPDGRRSTCMVRPFSYVSAARAELSRETGSDRTARVLH